MTPPLLTAACGRLNPLLATEASPGPPLTPDPHSWGFKNQPDCSPDCISTRVVGRAEVQTELPGSGAKVTP